MSTDGAFRGWGPHYKCRHCGCLWRNNHDETISLFDASQKSCEQCEEGDALACSDSVPGDEKLLAYLYNNNHATPFEMGGAIIEVQAPLFVFREWHRHRTQSYNELSARYTPLPDLYYMPTVERCMLNSTINKQAGRAAGADDLTEEGAKDFLANLATLYESCEEFYQAAMQKGIPKELARTIMPVGHYSRMRASANLRNWLSFLTLRDSPKAQYEIRVYAEALNTILCDHFPRTMNLFNDSRQA
jgi:thymidylate synthase (FAD)